MMRYIVAPATLVRTVVLAVLASTGFAWAGPQIQHWETAAGARVYFVESRALPMIDMRVDFAAGSAFDPPGLESLASMTRALLETGSAGLSENEISERIADTGAQFGGGTDRDRSGFTVRTLSSAAERDAALALAAQLIAQPTFPAAEFERERTRAIAGLREALTRPATLAARSFNTAIYGDHPYGSTTTEDSLGRITPEHLRDFHATYYVARNATVTIVGDLSRDEAERIAQQVTAGLPAGAPPAELTQPTLPARTVERIPHPSAQAHVAVGMPGLSREDPDYYPLLVGNHVLGGGGFTSRLTREVRDKRGFAYSVFSFFHPHRVAGPFQIGLQTRGGQADAALQVVEEVLADFIAHGPTEAEVQASRDNIINGFGLRLDSNSKILDHVAMIGFYQLPLDWLDTYPQHVAKVTPEAIQDAFARRIKPENLVIVVAGGDGDRNDTTETPAGGVAQN